MQYLLLIYEDEKQRTQRSEQEQAEVTARYRSYAAAAREAGVMLGANPLESTTTATSVRVRSGERLTTDGPFAETMEQLAGYFLMELPDLDAALRWAERIPAAQWGTIEVRPIWAEMAG